MIIYDKWFMINDNSRYRSWRTTRLFLDGKHGRYYSFPSPCHLNQAHTIGLFSNPTIRRLCYDRSQHHLLSTVGLEWKPCIVTKYLYWDFYGVKCQWQNDTHTHIRVADEITIVLICFSNTADNMQWYSDLSFRIKLQGKFDRSNTIGRCFAKSIVRWKK